VGPSIPFTIHVDASPDDRKRSRIVTIADGNGKLLMARVVVCHGGFVEKNERRCLQEGMC
jgi:hypothetical protein